MPNYTEQARELANRPYTMVVFRDEATDGDFIYLAQHPEIEGCMAQGETMEEAQANLDEVRLDSIEHLLKHGLPVPDPAWIETSTDVDSVELEDYEVEDLLGRNNQPENREPLFSAFLRTLTVGAAGGKNY